VNKLFTHSLTDGQKQVLYLSMEREKDK